MTTHWIWSVGFSALLFLLGPVATAQAAEPEWTQSDEQHEHASRTPAFDSANVTPQPIKDGVHYRITAAGAKQAGLEHLADKLGMAVFQVDFDETTLNFSNGWPPIGPNPKYRPSHHFDRWRRGTHAEAFAAGLKYLGERETALRDYLAKKNCDRALAATGQILHARQDFFSHSNFVDLSEAEQQTIHSHLDAASGAAPGSLKIAAFFYGTTPPGNPPGDPFTHDNFSKDHATKNAHAQEKLAGGRTRFEVARDVAIADTAKVLGSVLKMPGAEACFKKGSQ